MKNQKINLLILVSLLMSSCASKKGSSTPLVRQPSSSSSSPIVYKAPAHKQSGATVVRNGRVISGGHNSTTESGIDTAQRRPLSAFTSLSLQGAISVNLVQSDKHEALIYGDSNILKVLKTQVEGGKLKIYTSGSVFMSGTPKIEIHVPRISGISLQGATKLNATSFNFGSLSIDTQGASKVTLSGTATSLRLKTQGASKLNLQSLLAASASINSQGASKISVNTTRSISITAKGASDVKVYGGGVITKKDLYDGAEITKF